MLRPGWNRQSFVEVDSQLPPELVLVVGDHFLLLLGQLLGLNAMSFELCLPESSELLEGVYKLDITGMRTYIR